jgi:putative protein-disulfide isomerase
MKNNFSGPYKTNGDGILIHYYTDPLCCWSWAMEPAIQQLKTVWRQINWRYCMGGLLPSWDSFSDPVNSVNRPVQMGPVWMHASTLVDIPVNHTIWMKDPPASSYPACIAFKCVQFQSEALARIYLLWMREACMVEGINISKQHVLISLAEKLNGIFPAFNADMFADDLTNGKGRDAFREDLHEIKTREITRFPTLIIQQTNKASIIVTGYRTYDELQTIIKDNFIVHTTSESITGEMHGKG